MKPVAGLRKTVVLAGNPNVGKSTLFNQLTGSHQKIANYPGVTVEKSVGQVVTSAGQQLTISDLPGTYSLNTKTEDEAIAVAAITGSRPGFARPDVVVVVVEASKLKRALLLCLQIKRVHPQVIVALNMMDELESFAMHLDVEKLSKLLGIPVVPTVAKRGHGVCELIEAIEGCAVQAQNEQRGVSFVVSAETVQNDFKTIDAIVQGVLMHAGDRASSLTEKLDHIFLHTWLGPAIFLVLMFVMFEALFTWAGPLMDGIDFGMGTLRAIAGNLVTTSWLKSLVTDGIIAGVGSVLVFVPQIAIAFVFIGMLEMSGYLARGSFLIDRLMRAFGLEGRAFIPLMSSFACAIPGIMATRTMPNPRQRLITTLIAPLMTCSARLPVYILIIGTFVPATTLWHLFNLQGLVFFSLYVAAVVAGLVVARALSALLPKGPGVDSFLMELPKYRLPTVKGLLTYVTRRVWAFLKTAGTVIFVLSMLLWALAYFPRDQAIAQKYEAERQRLTLSSLTTAEKEGELQSLASQENGEFLRESFMGKAGRALEPIFSPMGFDWRLSIGILASFAAREVFVSTMGIVFNLGAADAESQDLRSMISHATKPDGSKAYSLATALSLLIFFAFAAQCISTLGVIKRETNSLVWPVVAFVYMTALAFASATLVYHGARFLS